MTIVQESKICPYCKKEFFKKDIIKEIHDNEINHDLFNKYGVCHKKDGRQDQRNYIEKIWKRRKYCSQHCSYVGTTSEQSKRARKNKIEKLSKNLCQVCGYLTEPRILEIHHILERCNGGTNSPDNLIVLCPNCHSLVHHGFLKINEGKWRIS